MNWLSGIILLLNLLFGKSTLISSVNSRSIRFNYEWLIILRMNQYWMYNKPSLFSSSVQVNIASFLVVCSKNNSLSVNNWEYMIILYLGISTCSTNHEWILFEVYFMVNEPIINIISSMCFVVNEYYWILLETNEPPIFKYLKNAFLPSHMSKRKQGLYINCLL